jgi:signal transduction histidine kinase
LLKLWFRTIDFLSNLYTENTKKSSIFSQNLGLRSRAKKLNETLAQKNEELEQFAHIIAHDLKTPLETYKH